MFQISIKISDMGCFKNILCPEKKKKEIDAISILTLKITNFRCIKVLNVLYKVLKVQKEQKHII